MNLNWLRNLKRGEKYDLSSIMNRVKPNGTFTERVLWLEQLVDWLRSENQTTRVKFLLQVFERNPEWKTQTAELISSLLIDAKLARLFTETGVPSWMSITHEFWSRFVRVFLPRFSDDTERSGKDAFAQIFYDDSDGVWVSNLPADVWSEFVRAIGPVVDTPAVRDRAMFEILEACLILAMKCGGVMVREDFAVRSPEFGELAAHPVTELQSALLALQRGESALSRVMKALEQMDRVTVSVREHLERYGVSVDLVFQLDRLKQYVVRIRELARAAVELQTKTLGTVPTEVSIERRATERKYISEVHALFVELVIGSANDQDFFHLMKKNFSLAAKKVVDFTGSTGDHYIARSPAEMRKLFWGAMGGGVITAFAVMSKYGVNRTEWPMFLDFLYAGTNYALAFLMIHFFHCTLATKQPSMTAATLANRIHTRNATNKEDDEFAAEVKRLIRSQSVSVIGNILAVIPVAILLEQAWRLLKGHPFFNEHEAQHLIDAVSPWRSGALLYGAMTGGLLWLGGIISGWMENAAVYYRIPTLIENHKVLRKILGPKRTTAIARAFLKNVSGVTSSVSLGFLLGAWPVLGKFLGLPLDIRHVTFSSGATAAAISSIGFEHLNGLQWTEVVLGILLIGVMNFFVSFLLALAVAIRAKEVPFRRALAIVRISFRQAKVTG